MPPHAGLIWMQKGAVLETVTLPALLHRAQLGFLLESIENAIHMLLNARNCANTTLIFVPN